MPINPNLVFLNDNTAMCVHEGIQEQKHKWHIVNVNAWKNQGLFSVHEINGNTPKLGSMCIKITTNHRVSSLSTPAFMTASGLDETELIFPDDELIKIRWIFAIKV